MYAEFFKKNNDVKCKIGYSRLNDGTPYNIMQIKIDNDAITFFDLELSDLEVIKNEIERYLKGGKRK